MISSHPTSAAGAAAFIRRREYQGAWALAWIWIHPDLRGRGLASAAWPVWLNRYGRFHVEGPLTRAGQALLHGTGHDQALVV